jgi:two-component system response regulator GlrR
MNGVDCAKKIRQLNLEMPIILSTGSMSITDNIDLKKIGISAFVTKPYEFDQLLETIQKLI